MPEISVAAVWAGPPIDDVADNWKDDAKVSALVARLAARRTPLDEAEKAITEFLTGSADREADAASCCSPACSTRSTPSARQVMNGLERFTRKQRRPPTRSATETLALQALQDAPPPDQAKIDELGNQLAWETRIFEDRRQTISFVCEVPTAIEQRLFALAARSSRRWNSVTRRAAARAGSRNSERQAGALPAVGAVGIPGHVGIALATARAWPRSTTSSNRSGNRSPAVVACRRRWPAQAAAGNNPRCRRQLAVAGVGQPDAAGNVEPRLVAPDRAGGQIRRPRRTRQHVDEDAAAGRARSLGLGGREHARAGERRGRPARGNSRCGSPRARQARPARSAGRSVRCRERSAGQRAHIMLFAAVSAAIGRSFSSSSGTPNSSRSLLMAGWFSCDQAVEHAASNPGRRAARPCAMRIGEPRPAGLLDQRHDRAAAELACLA